MHEAMLTGTWGLSGMTEAEIKAKLLEEDEGTQADDLPSTMQITPTTMMIAMFDLEEQQ